MEVYPSVNQFATPFHVGRYPRRTRTMQREQPTVDREGETAESLDEASTVPRDEQTAARPHLLTLYYPPDTPAAFIDKFPTQRVRKVTNQTLRMGRGEGVDIMLNDIHIPRSFAELSCRVHPEEGPKWCVKNKSNKKPIRLVFNGVRTSLKHEEEKELQDYCELKLETLRFLVKTEEGDVGELTEFELEILPMENDSTGSGSSFKSMNRQTSSSDDSAHSLTSAAALNRQRAGSGRGISHGVGPAASHFGLPLHRPGGLPGSQLVQQLTQAAGNLSLSQASTCCPSQYLSQHTPCQQCFHSPHVYQHAGHPLMQPAFPCGHQHAQVMHSPLVGHGPPHIMNSSTASSQGSQQAQLQTHIMNSQPGGYLANAAGPTVNTSALHPHAPLAGIPQQPTNHPVGVSPVPYQQAASQGEVPAATHVLSQQLLPGHSQPGALPPPQFSGQQSPQYFSAVPQQASAQLPLTPGPQGSSTASVPMSGSPYAMPELQGTSLQPYSSGMGNYPGLSAQSQQQSWAQGMQQSYYRDQGGGVQAQLPLPLRGPQSIPGPTATSQPQQQGPLSYCEGQSQQPAYVTQPESAAVHNLEMQQSYLGLQRPAPIISNPTTSDRNPQLYSAYSGNLPSAPPTTQLDSLRLGYPVQVTVSNSTEVSSISAGYPVQVTLPAPTEVTTTTPANSLSHSDSGGWNYPAGAGALSSGGEVHPQVMVPASAGHPATISQQAMSSGQSGEHAGAGSSVPPCPTALSSLTNPAANGNTVRLRTHDAVAATPPPSSDFSTMGSVQDLQGVNRVQPQGEGQQNSAGLEGQGQGRQPQENDERQPQEHDDQQT